MTELSALVRFLHLLASVLLAGYFAFDFLVLRRVSGNSPDAQILSDSKKSLARIVFGCILVAFITHGVGLWLQTALVNESSLAAVDLRCDCRAGLPYSVRQGLAGALSCALAYRGLLFAANKGSAKKLPCGLWIRFDEFVLGFFGVGRTRRRDRRACLGHAGGC